MHLGVHMPNCSHFPCECTHVPIHLPRHLSFGCCNLHLYKTRNLQTSTITVQAVPSPPKAHTFGRYRQVASQLCKVRAVPSSRLHCTLLDAFFQNGQALEFIHNFLQHQTEYNLALLSLKGPPIGIFPIGLMN